MRVRSWLPWLAVAAGSALFAWSRLDAREARLDTDTRRAAAVTPDPETLRADEHGPRLVGAGKPVGAGGTVGGASGAVDPATGASPCIELVVVDEAGRSVPRFRARVNAFEAVGSHGQATLALAPPGKAAPPGPYGVRVYGACDEAGGGLDLGAAHVQVATCDAGPVRVVLPGVDALTIHVRDEGGAGVQGLGVRVHAPVQAVGDAAPQAPPWPPDLGALTVAGITGAEGSVRIARAAPHLLVDVVCDVPVGFLPCLARSVEASRGRVELELRRGRAVDLQVDSALGRVARAQVELTSVEHGGPGSKFYASQRADEEGRARFPLLDPRARYRLFVQPPEWEPPQTLLEEMLSSTIKIQLLPGEDPFGTLAPLLIEGWVPADTAVRLERARVLSGRVVDGEGVPVTLAVVSVHAGERLVGRLETDDMGEFTWAQAPDGPLVLRLALNRYSVDADLALVRAVAPREREGVELRVETLAQRVLDVTFPSVRARDDACAPWGGDLDVFVRVMQMDGSWGAFASASAQVVPLNEPAAHRARLRIQSLDRGARAEVVVWQRGVGFFHAPAPAVGARVVVPLERGETLHLVTSRVRRGETWRVGLASERYDGVAPDVYMSIEEDGVLSVGGLPPGTWAIRASHSFGPDRNGDEPVEAARFAGALDAQARTGTRTVPTEVPISPR